MKRTMQKKTAYVDLVLLQVEHDNLKHQYAVLEAKYRAAMIENIDMSNFLKRQASLN